MRQHTKCSTSTQERARKALRACIRATRTLKSIDVTKVDADIAFDIKASIEVLNGLKRAFATVRTDEELLNLMYTTLLVADSFDDDSETVKLAN